MYTCYIQKFKILASFCSWAGWIESYLVENPRRHIFTWSGSLDNKTQTVCKSIKHIWTHRHFDENMVYIWWHPEVMVLHNKTNKMTSTPSKDTDQPTHQPSLISIFTVTFLCSQGPESLSGTQQTFWSDWTDVQAELSLHWVHQSFLLVLSTQAQIWWDIYICYFFFKVIWKFSLLCFGSNLALSCQNQSYAYANNKGANQPAHPHSLISTFVVHCWDSIVSVVAMYKISRL